MHYVYLVFTQCSRVIMSVVWESNSSVLKFNLQFTIIRTPATITRPMVVGKIYSLKALVYACNIVTVFDAAEPTYKFYFPACMAQREPNEKQINGASP